MPMNNSDKIVFTLSAGATAALILCGASFAWDNWYRLRVGYAWDTLRIRCEEERKGVLIGENCIKREAVIWSQENAPK
jgi:hypothetical protein